jgi:hypothetical protein
VEILRKVKVRDSLSDIKCLIVVFCSSIVTSLSSLTFLEVFKGSNQLR